MSKSLFIRLPAPIRWTLFALYVIGFVAGPLWVLWGQSGFMLGSALGILFLAGIWWDSDRRILARMHARPLSPAEASVLFSMAGEYCRRLQLPTPNIYVIEDPSLNVATVAVSRRKSYLVVTRGLLDTVSRGCLSAAVARAVATLWKSDCFGDAWLSQFLAAFQRLVQPKHVEDSRRAVVPFFSFLQQAFFYPLMWFPAVVLRKSWNDMELDTKCARWTGHRWELAELLRWIETYREKLPLRTSLSVQHLFLVRPPNPNPIARVLFPELPHSHRIRNLNQMLQVAG